jgi:alpha-D-xyloside xylohydrolase
VFAKPHFIPVFIAVLLSAGVLRADSKFVLERSGRTVVLEPYAPNIIRVTLSRLRDAALAAPGQGFVATPSMEGWTSDKDEKADQLKSDRLVVTVPARSSNVKITTASGTQLVNLQSWSMNPVTVAGEHTYHLQATFASPEDEHYYGLGQNQEGFLDLRGHPMHCWHNYEAPGGESVCVPFLITNRGYGLLWDNPSKTTVVPGMNEVTTWDSEVGERISFFVIAGATTDEIYQGYRHLTGVTHIPPKSAFGFIQSKQRYESQDELLKVAQGYRERHYPADMMVIDYFHWSRMGQLDMDTKFWPDPAGMNRQLHEMGFKSMISVWPRFEPGSRYFELLSRNGWLLTQANGQPVVNFADRGDFAGALINTINPAAGKWLWETVNNNLAKLGFDYFWTDETEPDLVPDQFYYGSSVVRDNDWTFTGAQWDLSGGSGARLHNLYPLPHTSAFFEGFRRDIPNKRALIMARAAYFGAQRNGTLFWSSDITPTWDALKRQVPTGLNFTATGFAYWGNDIAGWQGFPRDHKALKTPLLDPSDARDNVGNYDDYPELFTRWFEYGTFTPTLRTHGSRRFNEVWSYGKAAEAVLVKYLKLRYQMLHYNYSLAHYTYETGAPFMRALFMDFPNDPRIINIGNEYMFGPAFLVAPVTEQGATTRDVYLPAGADWYNFWTNERFRGGQTIKVNAPIDMLPLFVRAGSIVPFGEVVEHTGVPQKLTELRVYAGADGSFDLYQDDGATYDYENGKYTLTKLRWNDSTQKLSQEGEAVFSGPESRWLKVIGKGGKRTSSHK